MINIMNKKYKTRIYESISEKTLYMSPVLFFVKIDIYNYILYLCNTIINLKECCKC